MRGRTLAWVLAAALAVGFLAQLDRARDRISGSRILRQVELLSMQAAARGRAPRGILAVNLEALHRAGELYPVEIGVPVARASQHLLFGSPRAAAEGYRKALELEPRPEVYLNLGIAQVRAGETEEARRNLRLAVALDPRLSRQLPPEAQGALR